MSAHPPIDPGRWRQIEPLLDRLLDLEPAERSAVLDTACAGDPGLRAAVEAFLAADEGAGGFLGTPAREYAADLLTEGAGVEEGEADLENRQVGPYRLLRKIGSGGMGVVYEAEDTRLGRRVAVKFLPLEYSRDRSAKERFLREARAASALDHPNLCTVHDVGESDGRLYIVLTFYEGETLKERLQHGRLPVAEARELAIQVARGLARAHEAGIIHRDIKPANVMLGRRGEVKILDFGIAKLGGDDTALTRTGAALGTPAYMSPELARGEPVDARTDVWSLGVMLFEMLAGRRPFAGDGMEAVLSSILTREPEPLDRIRPGVPPELARVVAKALAKRPTERYASAAGMLADLESGRAPAASRAFPRWHRKALWAGVLAGVLAAVVFLTLTRDQFFRFSAPEALQVAIVRPVVTPPGSSREIAHVASEVVDATLATLLSLEGLQPLDPPEPDQEGSTAESLRADEADEVLLPLLDCQERESWCGVRFRRLRTPGGEVLGRVQRFEVPTGIENARALADGIQANLPQIYPGHRLRPDAPGGNVTSRDYAAYIQLERRVDEGERLGAVELERLDALLETSPDLLGAYLLAAGVANGLGAGYRDRALDYAKRAQELAPHDPRPLFTRLRIEVAGGQFDAARSTLARLEDLVPNDTRVLSARADLLEVRGELEQARVLREQVALRRPTWRSVLDLVTLEFRMGASDSARRHIEELRKVRPNNDWVLENLAAVETSYGDLSRAARIYEQLIRTRPARPYLTNLGFLYFLRGDYAAAVATDRRALTLEPDHLLTRFNLAAALEAHGDLAGARRLYRNLAKELDAAAGSPELRTSMLHAQCLTRLGQRDEAIRLAREALMQGPQDVQMLHQAAQVHALLGERLSALYYTQEALKKGLRPEWFNIPEFRSLEEDPSFRALLDSYRARKTEA